MPYNVRAELLEVYGHNPTTLRTLIHNLPDELVRRQGVGGEKWSILEIVCHLRDVEEDILGSVRRMIEEDRPRLDASNPDIVAIQSEYQSQSLKEALDSFENTRREQIAYLQALPDEAWHRLADDVDLGEISVQGLTAHIAMHDCVHLAQISRRIQESWR